MGEVASQIAELMPREIFCQCPETDGILNHYSMAWTAQDSQTEPVVARISQKQHYSTVAGDVLL